MAALIAPKDITGGILAGGKSRRFGTNKALYRWQEETFLDSVIRQVGSLVSEILISCSAENHSAYASYPYTKVVDRYPDCGPLGGIASLLAACNTPYLLVLTCDMPLIDKELLSKLLQEKPSTAVCMCYSDGQTAPFPLLLNKQLQPEIEAQIAQKNLKMKHLIDGIATHKIVLTPLEEKHFVNVNHIKDLNFI